MLMVSTALAEDEIRVPESSAKITASCRRGGQRFLKSRKPEAGSIRPLRAVHLPDALRSKQLL